MGKPEIIITAAHTLMIQISLYIRTFCSESSLALTGLLRTMRTASTDQTWRIPKAYLSHRWVQKTSPLSYASYFLLPVLLDQFLFFKKR